MLRTHKVYEDPIDRPMLTSCFACLWTRLSATRVFGHGPVNTKKIPLDGGCGGGHGVSNAKVNIVLEFCARVLRVQRELLVLGDSPFIPDF